MASVVGTRPNLSELVKKGESEEVEFNKFTSERTARNDIVDLVKMDILQKVGTTQATYYIFNIRQHSATFGN